MAQDRRYQDAVVMERIVRGKTYKVTEGEKVLTPKRIASLLPRDEFEALKPNFTVPVRFRPKAKKFTAWNVAGQIQKMRGIRGHTIRVTLNLLQGRQLRQLTFYRRVRRKGAVQGGLFHQMQEALQLAKVYLYNRIGNRIFPERRGRKVRLHSADVAVEM